MAKKKKTTEATVDMESLDGVSAESMEALDAMASKLEAVSGDCAGTEAGENVIGEAAGTNEEEAVRAEMSGALRDALAKQEEYLNMAQRVQADFENFRRRNQSVRKEAYGDGARNFAAAMLPVLDNLERALDAAKDTADVSLREGVELLHKQFCEVFAKHGISPISRTGEKFDPTLENAVMQAAPEDGEPGTVSEVLQKGYQMGDTVLRYAMVKVVPE